MPRRHVEKCEPRPPFRPAIHRAIAHDPVPLRRGSVPAGRMGAAGGRLLLTGPAELADRLRRELPLWRQVVAEAGIRPE